MTTTKLCSSLLLSCAIAFLLLATTHAKVVPTDLSDLARISSVVVRGTIERTFPTNGKTDSGARIDFARVLVTKTFRGEVPSTVDVLFVPEMSTSPRFSTGQEYVLFLVESPLGYFVARGYVGAVRLESGSYYTGDIADEPQYQSPADFLSKVQRAVSMK